MAATAQDTTAPLRGPEKKDEDADIDRERPISMLTGALQPRSPHQQHGLAGLAARAAP